MTISQTILSPSNDYAAFDALLAAVAARTLFLVWEASLPFLTCFNTKLDAILRNLPVVRFSNCQPNPLYESVVVGVEAFRAAAAATILCNCVLFLWILDKIDRWSDPRGFPNLAAAFQIIADVMDCPSPPAAVGKLSPSSICWTSPFPPPRRPSSTNSVPTSIPYASKNIPSP